VAGSDDGGPGRRRLGLAAGAFAAPAGAGLPLDTTLADALRLLDRHGREACRWWRRAGGGHPLGVATRAELLAVPARARSRVRLRDLIRLRVVYCFADSDVADAAAAMRAAG
jgi:CBS domain-containing protein